MLFLPTTLSFFHLLLCSRFAVGDEYTISSQSDFLTFLDSVNSGTDYSGTTVLLTADISLSEAVTPVGNTSNKYFQGTFDGQGYTIKDLAINTTQQYSALFGYSNGLTIKNVVLDSSCSFTNFYSGWNSPYVGSILGCCIASKSPCSIENSVSIADVTFNGSAPSTLYIGGIAAFLQSYPSSKTVYLKNTANYGTVMQSGSTGNANIGGIAGYLYGSYYKYLYNCLNHGTILHSGTSSATMSMGDIVGYAVYTYIENCVSAGKIFSPTKPARIGTVAGYTGDDTHIAYCYYTSELNNYAPYGSGTPTSASYTLGYDNATFGLDEPVSVDGQTKDSLLEALNAASDYYDMREYSRWVLNKNNKKVKFIINGRSSSTTLDSSIILLPGLATEGTLCFSGWYSDSGCSSLFTGTEVTTDKTLYGKFSENTNTYTITFDTRGGSPIEPLVVQFLANATLPTNSAKEHCEIIFWENKYGENVETSFVMPAYDMTLYAVWKCTHISTHNDFTDFIKIVNKGSNFYGSTVLLDSDFSLPDITEPISKDASKYFLGTFDGQGHTISDLSINTSSEYAGLFGYSKRLTIKNLVLDSSCSVTSTNSGSSSLSIGGIIGYCRSDNGKSSVENCVSMANVSFDGKVSSSTLYLGGIIGEFISYFNVHVKNCANYGSVAGTGGSKHSYIGGIVGSVSYPNFIYIYNCINYGTLTYNGAISTSLNIGGITGYSYYARIENCVSAGEISSSGTATSSYKSAIVGQVSTSTHISYCYYTGELNAYEGYAPSISGCSSYDNVTFGLDEPVSVDGQTKDSLLEALNAASDYYDMREYSHWALNKNNKKVKFIINGRSSSTTLDSSIILLPGLATEGTLCFSGWYIDSGCSSLFTGTEVATDKTLYGKFSENTNTYTVTFDTRREDASVESQQVQPGTTFKLPGGSTRGDCSIAWWENKYGDRCDSPFAMPAHDVTLRAVWKCFHIASADDFVDFSKVANSGSTYYSGSSVFLSADVSLSGAVDPIGKDSNNYFRGVFDGQGYVIKGLAVNTSLQYAGLFGYSDGLTIRNVVLDGSCSIEGFYNGLSHAGGIIGFCKSSNKECEIENCVNMASVTFSRITSSSDLFLGGIAGLFDSYSRYSSNMANCVNYGAITHSGPSRNLYIGGIVGEAGYSRYKNMYNCLNYGKITHSGTSSSGTYIGGIAGTNKYTYFKNCVSAGEISSTEANYIGSLVGYTDTNTNLEYCYYTSGVGASSLYGYSASTPSEANTPSSATTVDSTLVSTLNAQATEEEWNRWLLNAGSKTVGFKVHNGGGFSVSSKMVILPTLASDSLSFVGWSTDSLFKNAFTSTSVSDSTTLYGRWDKYAAILDTNGGSVTPTFVFTTYGGMYGDLPDPTKTGHTFLGWYTDKTSGSEITTSTSFASMFDHLVYAHWSVNRYTVSFVPNGGSECDNITQDYNTIIPFPKPTKTGYTLAYWCSDAELTTEYTATRIEAKNVTLYAYWLINNYTVTFDLLNGTKIEMVVKFGGNITYPEDPEIGGYTFNDWDTHPVNVTGKNITIKAVLTPNIYKVTLNSTVDDELELNEMTVTFNSTYSGLPTPNKIGYAFLGWLTEDNENVTSETIVTTPRNHTLYARWEELASDQAEVTFATQNLDMKKIEETLKQYTNGAKFKVMKTENVIDSGEMKVVIKFDSVGDSVNFVEAARASIGSTGNPIKKVNYNFEDFGGGSLSPLLYPALTSFYLIISYAL